MFRSLSSKLFDVNSHVTIYIEKLPIFKMKDIKNYRLIMAIKYAYYTDMKNHELTIQYKQLFYTYFYEPC